LQAGGQGFDSPRLHKTINAAYSGRRLLRRLSYAAQMDTRVSAYGVIVRDDSILLTHWTVGRAWVLPGGGIDPGEDPAAAAVREIREETGYDARLIRLIGVDSRVIPASARPTAAVTPLHVLRIVYEATVIGGSLTHETGGSSDEAQWVPMAGLARMPRVALVDVGLGMLHAEVGSYGLTP
jgi:8-oxo-dGTP diphosphatase